MTTMSPAEPTRRDFLYIATAVVGGVGAAAALVPLIGQMNPDASTIAAGAPIEVDLAPITENQAIKVFWRSKPIFISHRTPKEIDEARAVDERDGRQMAVRLAREEGVFAGTSSGLNVAAAVAVARELGPGRTVVTVAADTGLKYLAGDLFTTPAEH